MHVAFVNRLASLAPIVFILAAVTLAATAERRDAVPQPGGAAVRTVPPGARVTDDPRKKGDTYYWLESRTIRSTMKFGDTIVEASRGGDGKLHAKVSDRGGNDHGTFIASSTLVQFRPTAADTMQAQNDSGERPTLDRAARRDTDAEVDEVETIWTDGLVAKLVKRDLPKHEIGPGRVVGGPGWITTLTASGAFVGYSVWFERDQVFAYSLPGLTTGLIWTGPEHVKELYGGWPFKPDVTWLNLQTIAAHHFRTLAAKQGVVARACEPPPPNRLAQFFFPTLRANEPGCDGLHYLDGTILRECCDDHDRCYSKNGCTEKTWWQIWKSWSCDMCNLAVVGCFAFAVNVDSCLSRNWLYC
jgi:hypothetical protein